MASSLILAGWHGAEAVLARSDSLPRRIWLEQGRKDERAQKLLAVASDLGIAVERTDSKTLARLSDGAVHQGVVVEMPPQQMLDEQDLIALLDGLEGAPFLLILDGVQDPRNLGAALRVAAAAGVDAVIVPKDKSSTLTTVARKAAAGADFIVPLFTVTNLARTLSVLKERGIWLTGAAGDSEQTVYDIDATGAIGWVMGAEGAGLRRLTREACDYLAKIPMANGVESLNVSTAAAVCLFESARQRSQK